MKKAWTTLVWALCCFIWLMPAEVNATHIVGGDLTYRCLGNNLYEVRLTLRRDCFLGDPEAQFDDPASIGFFDGQTGQFLNFIGTNGQLLMPFNDDDTLNQEFISDCTISGFDVCVQQTTYVDTIQLPFLANGYILTYTRCCRNNTIQNIEDPIGTGMSLATIISGEAQTTCNSSPDLGDYAPIYICVNEPIDFDMSVEEDPQGDSVFYELFSPFVGGSISFPRPQPPPPPPYDTVVYQDPFSLNDLLGNPADPLTIDPITGRLTGTPLITGQFIVGVRYYSFNSEGILIEVTSREWQYNVRQCREQPVADYEVSAELNCDDLSLSFIDNSVGTELRVKWFFDFGNPDGDTSTDPDVTYTWDEPGFYDVALIVTNEDSICFDTLVGEVGVFESELNASFDIDVLDCGTDSIVFQVVDASIEPDLNYEVDRWEWYVSVDSDTLGTDTAQSPIFTVDSTTIGVEITLIAFSENGCSDTSSVVVDLNVIEIPFQSAGIDTIGVCDGDTVALFPFAGNPDFTYIWDPVDGLDLTNPNDPLAFPSQSTEYFVTVTDGLCAVGGEVVVAVQDTPTLDFESFTDCRSLEVEFVNNSDGGFLFEWVFGDGDTLLADETVNPTHVYDQPGEYAVSLISADGCDVITGGVVTVAVILDSVDDTSISCFAQDVELNPDADETLYSYEWMPEEGLNDAMSGNPTASVDMTTTFYVTITDIANPDCEVYDSVTVVVPGDFDLQAPPDSAYCGAPEIVLSAGNDQLDYSWTDIDGNQLSDNADLTVQPIDTTSYVITGIDEFGCSKSDTVTLEPTFFAYDVGPDLVICEGDDTTIFVLNMDPNQDLTYEWMPSEFIVGPSDVADPVVMPAGDQVFTVQITNNTLGCMVEEEISVSVSDFDYLIGGDEIICLGECVTLNVTNNDTTVLDYLWTPSESIETGGDGPTPTVCPEVPTVYNVDILNTDYGCLTNDSVFVNVSWFDPDFLEIFVEPDSIFANNNEFFEISTNQDDDLEYMWEGADIVDPTLPVIMASPTEEGEYMYSVTVTNADGCQLTGQTSSGLTVLDPACDMSDVFIPTGFSPNDDGANDELRVYSNFIIDMELIIYNRWGEEVFRSTDQDVPWDGTFEGEVVQPGVYGYFLRVTCPPNKEYMTQGSITVVR